MKLNFNIYDILHFHGYSLKKILLIVSELNIYCLIITQNLILRNGTNNNSIMIIKENIPWPTRAAQPRRAKITTYNKYWLPPS